MEDIKEKKQQLRRETEGLITSTPEAELAEKRARIEAQLFEFANFQESEIVLFYISRGIEFDTNRTISQSMKQGKDIVLPLFDEKRTATAALFKINDLESDILKTDSGARPDPDRCKPVAADTIDIAIVPGVAFDEKGARLGHGTGRYDKLIPALPNTARKVALAFEDQILPLIPMESHDKYVDIIITEKRIIYKI